MKLIVGLGNPEEEANYSNTRHNMGFMVLDRLAEDSGIRVNRLKHRALTGEGRIGGSKVMLVKPQTYMNNSGESLGEIVRYYHVEPENVIVIGSYDYNDVRAVKDLDPPQDRLVAYSFHCYEPHDFTHQGAYWDPRLDKEKRVALLLKRCSRNSLSLHSQRLQSMGQTSTAESTG